ncbi:hypothetical protein ACFXPY_42135 [Streptomyces sp. NPDC059153]|uniref:hypothetical protein n=1 Tax=Streptomyces sp. NPDC059153 TaxID=3346743 RepID=UPI0036A10D5A
MDVTRQEADGLARVCQNLDDIRDTCVEAYGDDSAVQRLLAAIAARQGVGAPLQDLDSALVRAGDVLGVLQCGVRGPRIPGADEGPLELVYHCPLNLCSVRLRWPQPPAARRCSIAGSGMSPKSL